MRLHAPQMIIVALWFIGLGIQTQKHGKPQTGRHNFWTSLAAVAITAALLWWGGFFS